MHHASATKWKWIPIIFLSARISKSIPSLLDTFLFFLFFSCCLLRVVLNFLLRGSCGNKIPYALLGMSMSHPSTPVGVRKQHVSWGSQGAGRPQLLASFFTIFSLCHKGIESTFLASLLLSVNGDNLPQDAVRKNEYGCLPLFHM